MASRHQRIGASEVAAILGLDPFKDALAVYNDKVAPVERAPTKVRSALWYGIHLEPSVVAMAEQLFEAEITSTQEVFEHPGGILQATTDLVLVDARYRKTIPGRTLVEIKTSGFAGESPENEQWGRAGTDQIPFRVLAQVQAQLLCSELEHAFVARLSGSQGKGLQVYPLKSHATIQAAILGKATQFWNNYVIPRNPPKGSEHAPNAFALRAH